MKQQRKYFIGLLCVCAISLYLSNQFGVYTIIKSKFSAYIRSIERAENHKHSYDYPSENDGWWKNVSNPVYGNSETKSVFDPYVYSQGDSLFVMILSERKDNTIIRLESFDGIHWTRTATLLTPVDGTWETYVNRACVIKVDSVWHMWYTGQSPDVSKIGHATSVDGISYVRDSRNPVLQPTTPSEGVSTMNPCVIYENGKYKMWYSAGENYEPDVIFYAESKDGSNWIKHREPVLKKYVAHEWEKAKVGGCNVLTNANNKKRGGYTMYYIGYQNVDVARICYATSLDGIKWERTDYNLLISPSRNEFDSNASYKPSVLERNDTLFMWYNGRKDNNEFIGLAYKILK